jgi:hypothetical protein
MKIPINPLAPLGERVRVRGTQNPKTVFLMCCFAAMFYHPLTLALSPFGERGSRYLPVSQRERGIIFPGNRLK